LIIGQPKENIFSNSFILDPRILLHVGYLVRNNDWGIAWMDTFPSVELDLIGNLLVIQLFVPDLFKEIGVNILEISNNRIQKRTLAWADIPNDANEFALFEA